MFSLNCEVGPKEKLGKSQQVIKLKIQFNDRLLKLEDSNADALWYPLLKKLGTK